MLKISNKREFKLGESISPQLGEVGSLLLFGYMGMGDAVMFEPTFRAYLRHFTTTEIDVIVGSGSQSLAILERIMSEENRRFRSIHKIDFKSLSPQQRRNFCRSLIDKRFDACLAVYTTPLQYFVEVIDSIPIRIGHTIRAQEWYKPRPNFLFNIARLVSQEIDEREPYRHFRLAYAIGIQSQGTLPIPHITIAQDVREWANNFILENNLSDKELIGVHLGVSRAMSWKKWPDSKYAKVFERLKRPNRYFLFFGSADEIDEMKAASSFIEEQSIFLAGSLNVMQVGALLEKCAVLVGNDSGIGHFSVALSVPTVRIFGPSDHYGCEPYTPGHVTLYRDLTCSPCMDLGLIKPGYNVLTCGHRNCLGLITVEEVTQSVSTLL